MVRLKERSFCVWKMRGNALDDAGIAYEVVPGVTALACAGYGATTANVGPLFHFLPDTKI